MIFWKKEKRTETERERNREIVYLLSTIASALDSTGFSSSPAEGCGITDFSSVTSLGASWKCSTGGGGSEGVSVSTFFGSSSAMSGSAGCVFDSKFSK